MGLDVWISRQMRNDLAIEWRDPSEVSFLAGAQKNRGRVVMMYSGVPALLYILGKFLDQQDPLALVSTLDDEQYARAKVTQTIEYANRECYRLKAEIETHAKLCTDLLSVDYIYTKKLNKTRGVLGLATLRDAYSQIPDADIHNMKFIGTVPASQEYPEPIHAITHFDRCLLYQNWNGRGNLLGIKSDYAKILLKDIVDTYGNPVIGALHPFVNPK